MQATIAWIGVNIYGTFHPSRKKEDMDYKLSYWQIENESSRHTDMEEKIKTGTEDG